VLLNEVPAEDSEVPEMEAVLTLCAEASELANAAYGSDPTYLKPLHRHARAMQIEHEYVGESALQLAHFPPMVARERCQIAPSPLAPWAPGGFAAICLRPLRGSGRSKGRNLTTVRGL
jgi:hypothetical protein